MSEKNISTAVISRFMTIDLPYYSQWLEYYDKLGFDYFYLYYIDDYFEENLEKVLTYYPKDKIQIIKVDKNKVYPNAVFKKILLDIKEEYVINVDSDEFLYLGGMNVKDFLKKFKNFNYFRFNWLMAPSLNEKNNSLNDILYDKKSPKYFLAEYKSLSKTKFINFKNTRTPHDFIIKQMFKKNIKKLISLKLNKNIQNVNKKFFIIHFCYRDMLDCFYKQLSQTLFLVKDKTINYFFNDTITFKSMPKRFLVYFSEIINNNPKINNININFNLTSTIDNNYLLNILKHKLNNKIILNKYVERINYLMDKFNKFSFFVNFKIHKSAKLEILRHFKKVKNFYIKFDNKLSNSLSNFIENDNNDDIILENINDNNNDNSNNQDYLDKTDIFFFEKNLNEVSIDKPVLTNNEESLEKILENYQNEFKDYVNNLNKYENTINEELIEDNKNLENNNHKENQEVDEQYDDNNNDFNEEDACSLSDSQCNFVAEEENEENEEENENEEEDEEENEDEEEEDEEEDEEENEEEDEDEDACS